MVRRQSTALAIARDLAAFILADAPASSVFFRPLGAFWDAMEAWRGLDIVDAGAGQGHVAAGLRARAMDAIGIDIRTNDTEYPVLYGNVATFDFTPGSVVLFARPCHSDLFVVAGIENAIACDASWIVYVGLPRNVESDLGRYRRRFRLTSRTHHGEAGELMYVYQVRRRR